MKKVCRIFGGLFLAAALIFSSACTNNDMQDAVLKAGDTKVTEKELNSYVFWTLSSSYSGVFEFDETTDYEKIKNDIKEAEKNEESADAVKKQKIVYLKQVICDEGLYAVAQEKGLTISDEDMQEIDKKITSIDNYFNLESTDAESTLSQIKEMYYSEDENGEEKAKEFLMRYKELFFNAMGIESLDELKEKYKKEALITKVLEDYKNSIGDDEEYVKKYYEEQLAKQKESYSKDISAFDIDEGYGVVICYYPSGLRYVKHILIQYSSDEMKEKLEQASTTIQGLEAKENPTDAEKKQLEEAKAELEKLEKENEKEIKKQIDDTHGKLKNGGDFDALLKSKGQDPGMQEGITATEGYLVHSSASYVKEFLDAAMALKNVGDISEPIKSDYGYHIIKYIGNAKEGEVPFEDVKDELLTVAMDEKRNDEILKYYDGIYEDMLKKKKATINYSLLGIDKATYDKLYKEIMENTNSEE